MSTILVTGVRGFIGVALAESLAKRHTVIGMGRGRTGPLGVTYVRGDFGQFEDLAALDSHAIDAVVHLAAVTGHCLERGAILVNVEGTRSLMRYLMDRGVRKFVLASSIAAVGFQSERFRPEAVPISDEHPCLDRDGYGLSKYLMEEVTRYYSRQNEEIDVINLRLCSIVPDDKPPQPSGTRPLSHWSLGGITMMLRSDTVRALTLAVESDLEPGVRTLNAAPSAAWITVPTAQILRGWWKDDVDLSAFEQEGREYDSVFAVSRITDELGFVADESIKIIERSRA